jgi:hypothetical protein
MDEKRSFFPPLYILFVFLTRQDQFTTLKKNISEILFSIPIKNEAGIILVERRMNAGRVIFFDVANFSVFLVVVVS